MRDKMGAQTSSFLHTHCPLAFARPLFGVNVVSWTEKEKKKKRPERRESITHNCHWASMVLSPFSQPATEHPPSCPSISFPPTQKPSLQETFLTRPLLTRETPFLSFSS